MRFGRHEGNRARSHPAAAALAPGPAALVLGLAALLALAGPAPADDCDCSSGDGLFTTHSGIVIDGGMADWASVLADPDNNSCDGGLLSLPGQDSLIAPQPDRDAPVQSTGRDLLRFAYTWDNTHVKTYTSRVASASNIQSFVYYADLDNDGLMETGERVVVATWKGSNRRVSLLLGTYAASQAGGDSMADTSGYADGYTLPGTVANLPPTGQPDYQGDWGSSDGLAMEWAVPWTDTPGAPGLGIPPGTAFTFHVSATNTNPGAASFPVQCDDNMGGCGGQAASTQYGGVTFAPDADLTAFPADTVYAAHTVTNTGNGADTFDLVAGTPTGDHTPTAAFYHDVDGSGTFTPGDTLLADTAGTGDPDTGPVAAGDSVRVLIRYVIEAGAADTATVVSTATSVYDDRQVDTVTDTIVVLVPDIRVTKTSETVADPVAGESPLAKAIPAALVDYTIAVENVGQGPADANTIVLTDPIPPGTQLFVGDLDGVGSGPVDFDDGSPVSGLSYAYAGLTDGGDGLAFSNNGGTSFLHQPAADASGFDPDVTHVRVTFTGVLSGDSGGGPPGFTIRFRVGVR